MKLKGLWNYLNIFGEWVMKALYLQLLWIFFTCIGLIVFGIMPSTITVFSIWRKLIIEKEMEEDFSIFNLFKNEFKNNFIKYNIFGWIYTLVGIFIFLDMKIVGNIIGWYPLYLVFLFILFLYVIVSLFLFPTYVHLDLKGIQYLKQALLIALASPVELFTSLAILVGLYYLFLYFPVLLFFISIPLVSYISTKLTLRAINRLKK